MKKIAFVTDSTAYITEELKNHPDVYVMPLAIIFGETVYEDGISLTTEQLYEKIKQSKEVPKTSQPAVGKFVELYEKLKEDYEQAIAVHISSKLSGTLESSRSASEMAEFPVEVVDSKSMSYAITSLIQTGMKLSEEGLEANTIAQKLREEADKGENYILLGSLEQFYKGGRMSGTQFLIGNLLQIKPIIRINQNGEFEVFEKVRSEKKAVRRLLELIQNAYEKHSISEVQIMHGNVLEKAISLEKDIKSKYPHMNVVIGEISSTIAAHAGEGTVAIIWQNK
ncbi:DegV family protein [Alkalihalobacterium chitinilyticum]|uniref:DegV family protein n=1 Tax=Alkalihalobacterium chitinilyticum TaxID=2980103 RepID=A0ABT5VLY6_9BACI|nr:DegV family protein [Alkalihalobacterium chitinilyticum]MDE5415513.1 DegV family protein [Alkalihalobacterium chitinilyticum]